MKINVKGTFWVISQYSKNSRRWGVTIALAWETDNLDSSLCSAPQARGDCRKVDWPSWTSDSSCRAAWGVPGQTALGSCGTRQLDGITDWWTRVWRSSDDGQGGLACCSPWGQSRTRQSDWTDGSSDRLSHKPSLSRSLPWGLKKLPLGLPRSYRRFCPRAPRPAPGASPSGPAGSGNPRPRDKVKKPREGNENGSLWNKGARECAPGKLGLRL